MSNGAVSIVAGVVFALVGANQAAGFLVMSWLAFIGIIFFYRAFTVTFSGKGNRRYGYLVFFLPSLVFWTSDISKEAMMTFLLGFAAYGCARILAGQATIGCWLLILVAAVGAAFIRPNEMLLEIGGFTVAMLFRPMGSNSKYKAGRRTSLHGVHGYRDRSGDLRDVAFPAGTARIGQSEPDLQEQLGNGSRIRKQRSQLFLQSTFVPEGRVHRPVRSPALQRARRWSAVRGRREHDRADCPTEVAAQPPHLSAGVLRTALPAHVRRLRGRLLLRVRGAGQPRPDHPRGDVESAVLARPALHSPRPTRATATLRLGAAHDASRAARLRAAGARGSVPAGRAAGS